MIVYTNRFSRIVYSCIFDTGNASSEANSTLVDSDRCRQILHLNGSMVGFFLNLNRGERKKSHSLLLVPLLETEWHCSY